MSEIIIVPPINPYLRVLFTECSGPRPIHDSPGIDVIDVGDSFPEPGDFLRMQFLGNVYTRLNSLLQGGVSFGFLEFCKVFTMEQVSVFAGYRRRRSNKIQVEFVRERLRFLEG